MKKAQVTFRFLFNETSSMETTHIGEGETNEGAIQNAWFAISEDIFKRNIIRTTKQINILNIQFIK